MAIIDTGLNVAGLRSEFFQRYDATTSYWQDLATRIASNKDKESYKWLGSIPKIREWGQGRLARGVRTESYEVTNLKYEATLEIDRDEIDDDQTGQIKVRVNELAQRAATHKDYLISQLLINGETSGFNSYDGVSFFNDAHVSGDSGNQDNKLGASATAPTDPTVAEFKTALRAAIAAMLAFKDDVGDPVSLGATGLVCVVPPSMYLNALETVGASIIANTSNILQSAARIIAFPWLTTATKWYLLKTDGVVRPFVFQDRAPVEFTALENQSDEGFRREKYLYGVRARYAMTYGMWQHATVTTFA
ncbi:MAG: Mu-like prophage major head subunit gpT family protein [Planctomycetota bacterium]